MTKLIVCLFGEQKIKNHHQPQKNCPERDCVRFICEWPYSVHAPNDSHRVVSAAAAFKRTLYSGRLDQVGDRNLQTLHKMPKRGSSIGQCAGPYSNGRQDLVAANQRRFKQLHSYKRIRQRWFLLSSSISLKITANTYTTLMPNSVASAGLSMFESFTAVIQQANAGLESS